jgi:hypothetical protein
MRILSRAVTASAVLLLASAVGAGEFKVYPGAKLDDKATREGTGTVYTTADPFAKVAAFYKGVGTEYLMPRASGTAGQPKKRGAYELWEAYFIFDGAKQLADSKLWAKVQRPALGLYKEDLDSGQVRDVTVIVLAKKP